MIYVLSPVRFGLPAVPSEHALCDRCGADCWLSKRAELGPHDGRLCIVCAMAVVKPGDTISAAPWVMADLEDVEDPAT